MGANAQTSVPAFTAGQVLTAAQVTGINTGIPVFASSTERDAAFGGTGEKTLAEGQMAYLEDTNATQYYDGSSWAAVAGGKILQVVSTTKTDTFSASITAGNTSAITGLSATITPTSAASDILIMVTINGSRDNSSAGSPQLAFQISRGGSSIGAGTTAGSRVGVVSSADINASKSSSYANVSGQFLDSPATTSATTYSVDVYALITETYYVNRTEGDSDSAAHPRTQSTITVMEVSA
jgi:hypothetical protein